MSNGEYLYFSVSFVDIFQRMFLDLCLTYICNKKFSPLLIGNGERIYRVRVSMVRVVKLTPKHSDNL